MKWHKFLGAVSSFILLIALIINIGLPSVSQAAPLKIYMPYGVDPTQEMDIYPSATPGSKLVILVHGGGWSSSVGTRFGGGGPALELQAAGFTVFDVNYRSDSPTQPAFRFHVISLPHTQTTAEYTACAYTQKVIKFCRMMKSLGHEVYLYASEENEASCDELITIVTKKEQRKWFGEYDFKQQFFNIDWNETLPHWVIPNARAVEEIKKRAKERDFICIIGGICQKQISDGLPELMSVEYGIGYYGVYAPYRVYESYAQMHYVHGQMQNDNGRSFDAVIPNYFDPKDFPYKAKKDDFYLYIGRMIKRKGPDMAVEVTKSIGAKLVLAGQGVNKIENNRIIADEITVEGDHIKHIGHADVKQRGELMSRAKAVFVMSYYLEPFGGTSIEPLFCGTPVITSDWGAFPENIPHGVVGYRARTLGEAIWAAQNVDKLSPAKIRKYAMDNFSLDRVKYLYQAYFEQLNTLWDENGWYSNWHNGVSKYHRYSKFYPK